MLRILEIILNLMIGMIFEKQKTSLNLIKCNAQTFLSEPSLIEAGPFIIFCKLFHLDLIIFSFGFNKRIVMFMCFVN